MMKIFTLRSVKSVTAVLTVLLVSSSNTSLSQQIDTLSILPISVPSLNMDASYERPFLAGKTGNVAVGGYLEANTYYSSEDGVSEGFSIQARRMTMFMSSSISNRIKFLSEIEFEEGGREINIEFAALDLALSPNFNFRSGIVMNPIGAFNQNHDGPKWNFVERPDMAVNMLPATWSNAGIGAYGKFYKAGFVIGYEAYVTNGFDGSIIDNEEGRTFLPSSKADGERFEESSNGKAMFTGKVAVKHRSIGELGLSYMGGVYNKFYDDGSVVDDERRVDVFAVDFKSKIAKTGTKITAEAAIVFVEIPNGYAEQYGGEQRGVFVDFVQPLFRGKVLDWSASDLSISARFDYIDWNMDMGDEIMAITPAISFRPTSETVFRLNYRYQWREDVLNNPAALMAAWMFGFSTYF